MGSLTLEGHIFIFILDKKLGVNIFSITVQNEPEFAAPWEACAYDPPSQASFIEHHLGPMLQDEHPDVKLLIFDHNKDHVITWGGFIVNGTNAAAKYVDGTAYHWYAGGMDRLLDGAVGQSNMHRYMKLLKDMNVKSDHLVLGSEGCHCPSTGYAGGDINVAWSRAERYAHTILADLAAGSNGFIEWNLILDAIGGPNHLGNLCDSPLLAVPYRAGGKHNVTIAPSFEPSDQVFSPVGDTRTREELNALGIPARYLDLGVVVQPMFFYMGHISRYVRPGSRAVDAIFDPSSVFRHVEKDGIVVAGGGVNNLARPGIDVTLWPCEGSTRQKWEFDSDGRLRVYGHDWLGQPMISCIGKESDPFLSGLLLNECNDDAGVFQIVQSSNINETHDQPRILFSLQNGRSQNTCLVVLPVANRGGSYGPKGGGQVTIGDCSESSALWNYNVHGEVRSSYGDHNLGDVCLTTGWPFLQIGAFLSPSGEKIAIILNEAADAANYELLVDGEVKLTNAIPPHAIQTLVVLEHI
jgi:glucosylceramidase